MFHIDDKEINHHDINDYKSASFTATPSSGVVRKVIVVDQEKTDLLDHTPTFVWSHMCLYCGLSPPLPQSAFPLDLEVNPSSSSSASSTTFSSGATINECCSVCFMNQNSTSSSSTSDLSLLKKELEMGLKNLGCSRRIKRHGHQRHAPPNHDHDDQKSNDSSLLKKARSAHAL